MDSTTIYWEYSSMEASHPKRTIFSLVTTLTAESSPSRPFAFFSATKSSIPRTSSFWEAITNVHKSIESTVSTTNANAGTLSDSGASLATSSIASPSPPSSTRKFSACMVAWARNWKTSTKSKTSCVRPTFPTRDFCAIYCGPIRNAASRHTATTIEASPLHLASKWCESLTRSTTSIWSAARIKSSRTGTNSSNAANLLLSSAHLTIVVNLTTLVQWWALMRLLCAAFRFSSQQIKERILVQLTEEHREVDLLHQENEKMLYAYLAEQKLLRHTKMFL